MVDKISPVSIQIENVNELKAMAEELSESINMIIKADLSKTRELGTDMTITSEMIMSSEISDHGVNM